MQTQITEADLALLDELGEEIAPEPSGGRTAREERIIAGFEEIERFVAEHGRLPQHGEQRDIFERLYAVRLERLRASAECRQILQPFDARGLLNADANLQPANLTDEDLLAELGGEAAPENDITNLVHVRSRNEIKAAEEIAQRTACQNFAEFKSHFEQVQSDLDNGQRRTVKYRDDAEIRQGDWFVLDGQKVFVAEMGKPFTTDYGRTDRRLRVIYDNATESDLLLRSLQRALNKDKASRRITNPDLGPLFAQIEEEEFLPTGYVYVLRSQSEHPFIAEHRNVIHKIGVTGGDVKDRIANAKKDPTYLLADVEIVATFKLVNLKRKELEALLQRFFVGARLELELTDRFGALVKPREWFLVPFEVIEQVIKKIEQGTIDQFRYDRETASLSEIK
jgi:hypothetical protein